MESKNRRLRSYLQGQSELRQRTIVGACVITLLTAMIVLLTQPYFYFVFAFALFLLSAAAIKEYNNFAMLKGVAPAYKTALFCTLLYLLSLVFFPTKLAVQQQIMLSCLFFIFFACGKSQRSPLLGSAATLFALAYIAFPLCSLYDIVYIALPLGPSQGRMLLLYLIATTKSVDLGGYFIGKRFGRRPLAKTLSPKKTVEGAIGGTFAAVMTSTVFYYIDRHFFYGQNLSLSLTSAILWGCIFAFFAQCGDLAESLLKRDAGVKDSSSIPGLGGILDMLDSLLFTIPLVRYFWFY